MAQRKSKKVREVVENTTKRLKEVNELLKLAEQEEKQILDDTEINIQELIKEFNLFCGVILTHEDIISILRLALQTNESIKIPFKLYFNE